MKEIPPTTKYREYYHVDIFYGLSSDTEKEMYDWLQEQARTSGMVYWISPIASAVHFDEEQDAVAFKLKFGL